MAGLDLVRNSAGELQVLEDNVRTPSGYAYATATARALRAALPFDGPDHDDGAESLLEGLAGAVRGAPADRSEPEIAVVSDGEDSAAHFEHALAASHLGAKLLRLDELVRDGDMLLYRDDRGGEHAIDVVYRRCEEDRLFDEHGDQTLVGELLLEPWLAGSIAIVNGFGTGVADDKLAHAYVEEMVRFYLDEEPLLRSVPTLDLTRDENLGRLLEAPEEYVVKPRGGQGGGGVVVCAHAAAARRAALPGGGARAPGRVRRAAADRAVDGADRDRRQPRPAPRRPAAVRLQRAGLDARRPGRAHARGLGRGRARRQLLAERRRQGDLGAALRPDGHPRGLAGRDQPTTVPLVPTDIVPTARELLDALGSNTWTDGRADRLIQTLGESIGSASPAASRDAMATLASGLNSLDPEPAGVASRVVGAMIEAGHDPRPARPAMLGALQQTLPVCADLADAAREEIGEPPEHLDEDEAEDWLAERARRGAQRGRRPQARPRRPPGSACTRSGPARSRCSPSIPRPAPRRRTSRRSPSASRTSTRRRAGCARC